MPLRRAGGRKDTMMTNKSLQHEGGGRERSRLEIDGQLSLNRDERGRGERSHIFSYMHIGNAEGLKTSSLTFLLQETLVK